MPNLTVTVNDTHDATTHVKSRSTDVPMIDVESIINEEDKRAHELILAKEIRMQAEAVQLVRDASEKWLSQVPDQKRNDIETTGDSILVGNGFHSLLLYGVPPNDCPRTMERLYGCYRC